MQKLPGGRMSPQLWLGLFTLVLALWLTITYASLLIEVLAALFGAFLISLAIRPVADWLGRWRVPRAVTVLAVYLLVIAVLALVGALAGTAISSELAQLRQNAPDLVQVALARLQAIPLIKQVFPSFDVVVQNMGRGTEVAISTVFDAATSVGHITIVLILVVILAFFFVTDQRIGERVLSTWVPEQHREHISEVATNVTRRLSRWVVAQVLIMIYFTVVYGVGLLVIGVPFALIIAIIGGILELVPFVGGIIALLLSVLAALTVNPTKIIWVVILYAVVTQIEANVIQPRLYSQAVDVHPAVVLIGLFVGAAAGGIFGALLAVPVVVVLVAILSEFRQPQPPEEPAAEIEPASPD